MGKRMRNSTGVQSIVFDFDIWKDLGEGCWLDVELSGIFCFLGIFPLWMWLLLTNFNLYNDLESN